MSTITQDVIPNATPTEEEIAAWQVLPRDEQVRKMQEALSHPDCSRLGTASMQQLRERGRDLAAKLRNG